jgi:hypothetical protein
VTNINDMGLPQGLPELAGSYGIIRWPQDYDNAPPGENNNRAREMTAADLGLSLQQWDPEWLTDMYGLCPWRIWKSLLDTDAPYSFWLGADA